jgi:hypothetical protein
MNIIFIYRSIIQFKNLYEIALHITGIMILWKTLQHR